MNLIYSHSYASARAFALHHEFMPGDWKWLQSADLLRQHARADVFKVERWEANPHREQIDEALARARRSRRLGSLVEVDAGNGMLGVRRVAGSLAPRPIWPVRPACRRSRRIPSGSAVAA